MDKRHPGGFGFVGEKRPSWANAHECKRGPLGLAKPYPLADSRQLFDGDATSGAFSLGQMRLEISVVNVGGEARSLRRRFFNSRRAELVFLACNRFRNRAWRLR